jgi:protease-4
MKKALLLTLFLLTAASAAGFSFNFDSGSRAAVIDLSGTITPSQSSGLASSTGITPDTVRSLNDKAVNQGADAIIYEINSGGGAVVSSKEIYRSIEDVSVPTVCRMRDVAASGAYLMTLGCDEIVADSATLTGSIGVKSSYLQYTGLMEDLGVEYVNISAGSMKEVGSPYTNISEEDKQLLQEKVDIIQENFLNTVERERNLTTQQMENVNSGAPFLGVEAKKLDLVDTLGGRDTAVETAENLTDSEVNTFIVERDTGFNFLSLLTSDLSIGNFLEFSAPFRSAVGY